MNTRFTRLIIYTLFFLSGAVSLIYEIVWARQFVPIFGNSSYSITVVLAAFMAGLGLGSWWFGKFTDKHKNRLLLYAMLETGIAVNAFLIPFLLLLLKKIMPFLFSSLAESILIINIIRFLFSFLILLIPSILIGGTLPVLSRFCISKLNFVGHRISLLYGLNTIGAAVGVFSAGYFLIETLGLSGTNYLAIFLNLFISAIILITWFFQKKKSSAKKEEQKPSLPDEQKDNSGLKPLILTLAFITGCVSLSLEILWTRFMYFRIPSSPYSFTSILGVFLICLGIGSLLNRIFFVPRKNKISLLAYLLIITGPLTLIMLTAASKYTVSFGLRIFPLFQITPLNPLWEKVQSINMAAITIFIPAVLLGITFPALCTIFTRNIKTIGENIGKVYAVNTIGSISGSFLPVFILIPLLGIRTSLLLTSLFVSGSGIWLLFFQGKSRKKLRLIKTFSAIFALFILFSILLPPNLSKDLFLSTIQLGKHNDIIYYKEGRTATSILVKDKVSGLKDLYINSVEEVPTSYAAQYCFKLMGMLGALIHPNPDKVLMICFGGGIAAGSTIQHPKVKSLEVVDIEPSIISAAPYLSQENNDLLKNNKVKVMVEDGRNFLFMTQNKYPLIISDSTHPKSADSWVLYTREFYQAVKEALAEGGVFVQWLPFHNLTTQEYQIILKTFQSEFPHASLWLTHAFDEMGRFLKFSLVVGTPETLSLDYQNLKQQLNIPSVKKDLIYWNLHTASGIMENFLCGEDKIREWTANVPLNTDNLPWSYYNTKYSQGEKHTMPDFSPLAENIWSFLSNTGNFEESYALKSQLDSLFWRKKLFLQLKFKTALDMIPQEKKAIKEKENIETSKKYLINVSEFYPHKAKNLLWLARGLRTLLGISGSNPGEDKALLDMLYKSVQADPSFSESHLELAEILWTEGKKEEAYEYYKQVAKINPDSFIANMRMGNFLSNKGKNIEAVKYFRKAIKIQPQNPNPYNNLAAILIQQNKLEEAVLQFKEALKINPNNAEIHNNLGAALLKKGNHKEAEKHFKEALSINPENYMAITNLANILSQKNEPEKAATLLYKAVQVNPKDSQSRQLLALSLIKLKTYSQAIKVLQEGLRISPDNVALINILAKLLLSVPDPKLQDWKQALTLAKHACEVTEEKNPECLDILASAYATQGNFKQAAVIAQKAYDLALTQGQNQMANAIKKRLEIFESYLK